MESGFYNIQNKSVSWYKRFYLDAIYLSYRISVEDKYVGNRYTRATAEDKSVGDLLKMVDTSDKLHYVCIDRSIQHSTELVGEVGFCSLDTPSYFLFCYMNLDNLNKLVNKWKLTEME